MGGKLDGKVALISGGAEGLGEATARLFVAEGARVVLGDIQFEKAQTLARAIGSAALAVHLDVTVRESWQAAIAATLSTFGKLNILINNAGISEPGDIETCSLSVWQRTIDINLNGVFHGCQLALEPMRAAKESGAIVNLSSMLGVRPGSAFLAYCASKAGVAMLTKCVALHCAKAGYPIRCNSVHPGAIDTPMYQRYLDLVPGVPREEVAKSFAANHPMGRVGQPQEIAKACLFLCSDDSSFTTGMELSVDGGGFIRE